MVRYEDQLLADGWLAEDAKRISEESFMPRKGQG